MGVILSSLVVIVASISPINNGYQEKGAVFAISSSCVTFVLGVAFLVVDKRNPGSMPAFAYFGALFILAVSWIIMAAITTFQGPFNATGNGYFASWAGALASSLAAFEAMNAL